MAYTKKQQQAAIEMAAMGIKSGEIARKLKINVRTIRRWIKDVPRAVSVPSAVKLHEIAEVEKVQTEPHYDPPPENYLESIGALVSGSLTASRSWWKTNSEVALDDCVAHTAIIVKLERLLHNELDAEELNAKRAALLSLCLVRHCDARTKALNFGRGDMISLAQAYARVQTAGKYVVLPEKLVDELLRKLYPSARIPQQEGELEASIPTSSIPSSSTQQAG